MWSLRLRIALATILLGVASVGYLRAQNLAAPVVVVPIVGAVDRGTEQLVHRALQIAAADHAQALLLNVNSESAQSDSVAPIRDAIQNAPLPTIAYISGRALSGAALVALAAKRIVMAPTASIGSLLVLPSVAQSSRTGAALVALKDAQNLDSIQAMNAGLADAIAPSLQSALLASKLAGAPIVEVQMSFAERIASLVSEPLIAGLLIGVGFLGLLIEMQTLHGIAGLVGITALTLYFGVQLYSGFSNSLIVALAVLGLIGILWELHVIPGHTLPGAFGALLLLGAVLFSFGVPYLIAGVETLATAIVLATIGFSVALRNFPENAWSTRLALAAVQGPDFVTSSNRHDLLGKSGSAATYLRPAGHGLFDGERVDVLTAGEFIAAGTPIRIVRVEGSRIFVEPIRFPLERITS
ncbi:MAG TPA: NfeD family protein [Candidatus Dormibacteraeota bacterium]|nr:NfeD family protein [Candidatus Dormibacteraeota bacterium]